MQEIVKILFINNKHLLLKHNRYYRCFPLKINYLASKHKNK